MSDNYPVGSFYFNVKIGGSEEKFMEVSGLSRSLKTEDYIELGENSYITKLPNRVSNDGNLVLKRGILNSSSSLVGWCKNVLEDFATPITTKMIMISLLDQDGNPAVSWSVENAYPVKWSVEKFSAMDNKVAIESIEFAYTVFKRMES